MEYYSAVRKNEILPFITTRMDLGGYYGKRNKSDRKTNAVSSHLHAEAKQQTNSK